MGGVPGRPPFWRTLEESCKGLGSVSLKINNQHSLCLSDPSPNQRPSARLAAYARLDDDEGLTALLAIPRFVQPPCLVARALRAGGAVPARWVSPGEHAEFGWCRADMLLTR